MIMDIVLGLGITSNISDQLWKLMRPTNSWGGGDIYPVVFIGLTWFTYGHCVSLMGSTLIWPGHCVVFLGKTLLLWYISPPRSINGYLKLSGKSDEMLQ